ncbi:NG-dimethylarginine dimethylaminohydrolase 1 [Candidatus Rhodobacter oscarellae]|uniref:NG-dimethylarginine dimethylaminohydrolase 1 n=1 Tax=Candidatus Rhodobacter oscarellae TaxID=1675527 RepID=A0A0J9E1Q1_9RHOB|nr:arginine deiminase family protein [Candidatus Rhodobacter lobularis]KMW56640.1 NG-dimethylarginine dimethylaminohydrolase 1 [Candidatus Rhodobacter lobularis]
MNGKSYRFTHAICREVSASATQGLRAVDIGAPDLAQFRADHADYVAVLRSTGAEVTVLPALEAFPDGVFVEDAAICLAEGAVVTRPGAPSRLGEAAAMAPVLEGFYEDVVWVEDGFIEGGDVLVTEREILVGTSARTDATGIATLTRLVARWGYALRVVETPPGVLHFKTDCALLDEETVLATPRLAASGCFEGYRVIHTGEGEEAAANVIRFNDLVVMPSGFARTQEAIEAAGYTVRPVGNSEAAKLDGGMSCLSLRFSPAG